MAVIHKWRVLIIMAHDGESFFEYNDLEQSILDQKQFKNLSYYFLYYNQKLKSISIKKPSIEDDQKRLVEETDIKNIGNDFYKKGTLIKFLQFVKGKESEESKGVLDEIKYHYFVITWGHGGGLFYFPDGKFEDLLREFKLLLDQNGSKAETIKTQIRNNLVTYMQGCGDISCKDSHSDNGEPFCALPTTTFISVMGFPDKKVDKTLNKKLTEFNKTVVESSKLYTATDMNEIFTKGLGKIDVYFSLNCFTQMIDTGYELRNTVKMMVSPQTTMPLTGINYKEVFATLENDPAIPLTTLAQVFVSSFSKKYTGKFLDEFLIRYPTFKLPIVSFSCNILENYELLVRCLNDLTDLIRKIYKDERFIKAKRKVGDARKLCGDLTPENNYGIIDLNNFVQHLQAQLPFNFVEEITVIREKLECVKKFVLVAIKKPDLDISKPGFPTNNPMFLSFFAPAFFRGNEGVWKRLLDVYPNLDNEFTRKSEWVGFVKEFAETTELS